MTNDKKELEMLFLSFFAEQAEALSQAFKTRNVKISQESKKIKTMILADLAEIEKLEEK